MNPTAARPAAPDLSAGVGSDEVVLVFTDAAYRGRAGLAMPFKNATVIAADGCQIPPEVSGPFDTIIIDRNVFDLREIDGCVQNGRDLLRPGGRLVVVLDHDQGVADGPTDEAHFLSGLQWNGIGRLNGRPCAVMTTYPGPGSTSAPATDPDAVAAPAGLLLASLAGVLRIADENHSVTRAALDRARIAFADEIDDRHQSERELLDQVETLVAELDQTRQQLIGANAVRTVLRQSKPGRVALRALRPAWRAAKGVRRGIRGLRRGGGGP